MIDEYALKMPFVEAVTENAIGAICHSKTAGSDLSWPECAKQPKRSCFALR
jgi:hypothetical protein